MKLLIGLAFWILIAYVGVALWKKLKTGITAKSETAWPVTARKTLLNEKEQIVFNRLTEAFPDWIVLAQVALSQVVSVKAGKENGIYRNKINQKVLDFVVCRQDTSVVAAFELNGNSHDSIKRMKSDESKGLALSSAGIQLIQMNTKTLLNGNELRSIVGVKEVIEPTP